MRYNSIRVLLALAAERNFEIKHFDVQIAFLYGDLEETIYMKQPPGFEDGHNPDYVCLLKKSLYDLKQATQYWNHKFVKFLNKYDFKQLKGDQCVFVGKFNHETVYLTLYVDDGLVMSSSIDAIDDLIENLVRGFNITVGDAKQFVGIEIARDRKNGTITIGQRGYVKKIIEKFNMSDAKPSDIPAEPSLRLQSTSIGQFCKKGTLPRSGRLFDILGDG